MFHLFFAFFSYGYVVRLDTVNLWPFVHCCRKKGLT